MDEDCICPICGREILDDGDAVMAEELDQIVSERPNGDLLSGLDWACKDCVDLVVITKDAE